MRNLCYRFIGETALFNTGADCECYVCCEAVFTDMEACNSPNRATDPSTEEAAVDKVDTTVARVSVVPGGFDGRIS